MLKPRFDADYFQELSLSIEEIESLMHFQHEILEAIALSQDYLKLLNHLCEFAQGLLPQSVASIMLLNEEGLLNVLTAPSVSPEGIEFLNGLQPGPHNGSCGNAAYHNLPQFICNTETDPRCSNLRELASDFNLLSCWSLPIHNKNNKVIGTFALSSFVNREPDSFHRSLLNIAVYLIEIILQQEELYQELTFLAYHDSLTHLPNRHYLINFLEEKLNKTQFNQPELAILFLDLDRFKTINDIYGHNLGDKVLCDVADRLKLFIEQKSFVSRLGGDEFVIVLSEVQSIKNIKNFAKLILKELEKPLTIEDKTFYLTASIGISLYPEHGREIQELLSNADLAMYEAKKKGINKSFIYSQELSQQMFMLFSLENELRQAIKNEQLELFYQPKVANNDVHNISGAEALIRWRHPQKGLISPEIFIPLAEESNLIYLIGEWIVEQACKQIKIWSAKGFNLRLSVNLSRKQLTWVTIGKLLKIIDKSKINPELLEFEITETYVMENIQEMSILLKHIQEQKIQIALDDFGVGYSSLAVLKSLPLNTLKIDKSLVSNVTDNIQEQAILESIIKVGKVLNLNIVAEGIETKEQNNFLAQIPCDELQGFYFSKPLTLSDFENKYLLDKILSSQPQFLI